MAGDTFRLRRAVGDGVVNTEGALR